MPRPHSADQPRSAAQSPSPARSPSRAQSPSAGQSRGAMQSHGTDQPRSAPAPAVDAVRCAGLRYRFGAHVAVDQVDLLIAPGETFGLLGPNGAGKTTTIRMLTTLLKPDEGTITVFGVDAAAQPMRVRRLIGYVPQLLSADASLTGWGTWNCSPGCSTSPAECAGGGWLRPYRRWASPKRPSGW
jgi:ABC-type multidrug transport system fused ATPase/permease subunit